MIDPKTVPNVRFDKAIRHATLSNLLAKQFPHQSVDAFQKRFTEFADKVYFDKFSSADRRKMKALPNGYLPKTWRIRVEIAGYISTSYRKAAELSMSEERLMTYAEYECSLGYSDGCLKRYETEHPLCKEFHEIIRDQSDFTKRIKAAEVSAEEVLKSCRTYKQLCAKWPEAAEFVPDWAFESDCLPAVQMDTLNEMLGLTTKGKKDKKGK